MKATDLKASSENDLYKFYHCGTHTEAMEVEKALTAQGRKCEKDFGRYGWFVRERKDV